MKTAKLLACCLLIALENGTLRPPVTTVGTLSRGNPSPANPVRLQLQTTLRQNSELFRSGRLEEAERLAQTGYRRATEAGEYDLAARFLGNLGSVQFASHQFEKALQTYLRAHELAKQRGELTTGAALTANIASLYSELGEYDSAAEWLEKSASALSGNDRTAHLPSVQIQLATVRARQNRLGDALDLFSRAIAAADRSGNTALCAIAWNRIGEEYLRRNDLAHAEPALLEAWRLRKFHDLPLDSSWFNLGKLRLAQGDIRSAEVLVNRAVEHIGQAQGLMPTWDIYQVRGRIRLSEGKLEEALSDFRAAVRLARTWRLSAPPDDASRVATEAMLQEVYSALIDTGNRLYLRGADPALVRETLETAEENRAASLRALVKDPKHRTRSMPPAYWAAVSRLQRAEVEELLHPDAGEETVRQIRAELVRMEAGTGAESGFLPQNLLARTQQAIDGETAVLAFHLHESGSWLWAIDQAGIGVHQLPPRSEIAAAAQAFAEAVRQDAPDTPALSARLYAVLFGKVEDRLRSRARWLVALDAGLFEAPLPALIDRYSDRPKYLIETHALQVIPGLSALLDVRQGGGFVDGPFVGLGDAIFNTADPRYARATPSSGFIQPLRLSAAETSGATISLPRLVASGAEIESCARAWGGSSPLLLRGAEASRSGLESALRRNPSVLHIATHVLPSAQRPAYGLMVLSLGDNGRTEVITPFEVARWRADIGLVVLSGCASAAGGAIPGTGMLGMTRAWLAAGARQVVASRWATPDDTGALFLSLYSHMKSAPKMSVAGALRQAQKDMISAGGWRSRPAYWGAYFVVGQP